MIRKLLKRKLKIVPTKKLKTINHKKSALSQWAIKQLFFIQNNRFSAFFPGTQTEHLNQQPNMETYKKPCTATLAKQIISRQLNGFTLFQSLTAPLSSLENKSIKKEGHTYKASQKLQTWLLKGYESAKQPNGPREAQRQDSWTKYPLRLISKGMAPLTPPFAKGQHWGVEKQKDYEIAPQDVVHNHWKNLYSLDQLLSYQIDSQLRFRCSPHKRKLIELQKLTALYGKLPKKQCRALFRGSSNSPQSRDKHNIPLILEMRLDAAVKRCFAFSTLSAARHWISQGRIWVNNSTVTSPNYQLDAGDCVSIAPGSNERYKKQFLQLFALQPRERKYCASGRLMQRWKEWAALYGCVVAGHKLANGNAPLLGNKMVHSGPSSSYDGAARGTQKTLNLLADLAEAPAQYKPQGRVDSKEGSPAISTQFITGEKKIDRSTLTPSAFPKQRGRPGTDKLQYAGSHPDKAIKSYWYASGRFLYSASMKIGAYCHNKPHLPLYRAPLGSHAASGKRIKQWLERHPWPSQKNFSRKNFSQRRQRPYRFYFNNWKAIYRRRIFVFSQWLLDQRVLISDGLYHCRWFKGFIRKKSAFCNIRYKQISLQKPLHFEISPRKQCAVLLYPPQKLLWPCMIDLKKLHP